MQAGQQGTHAGGCVCGVHRRHLLVRQLSQLTEQLSQVAPHVGVRAVPHIQVRHLHATTTHAGCIRCLVGKMRCLVGRMQRQKIWRVDGDSCWELYPRRSQQTPGENPNIRPADRRHLLQLLPQCLTSLASRISITVRDVGLARSATHKGAS